MKIILIFWIVIEMCSVFGQSKHFKELVKSIINLDFYWILSGAVVITYNKI